MVSFSPPDIYGQRHPHETPELIASKLQEFHAEVENLPKEETTCVRQAKDRCPQLLDDEFHLLFLRCEVFNVDLAAKRYAKYWTKRVELFGEDKAFEPLTLEKALRDDRIVLELGMVRPTGTKDPQSDRSIIFLDPSLQDKTKYTRESMTRSVWYIFHAVLEENIVAQQRGVIMINYPHHAQLAQLDRTQIRMIVESIKGYLPVRMTAMHLCHPPVFFAVVFPIIKLFLGERLRKRLRVHAGSQEHVLQHLEEKFGLTKDVLPSDIGGNIVLDHHQWLEDRALQGK